MIMQGIMHSLCRCDVKQVAQPISGGLGLTSGGSVPGDLFAVD